MMVIFSRGFENKKVLYDLRDPPHFTDSNEYN